MSTQAADSETKPAPEDAVEKTIKDLQLNFFDRLRMKLMSKEEREAFLIEKVEKKAAKCKSRKNTNIDGKS